MLFEVVNVLSVRTKLRLKSEKYPLHVLNNVNPVRFVCLVGRKACLSIAFPQKDIIFTPCHKILRGVQ
jgi:hypothetical protein